MSRIRGSGSLVVVIVAAVALGIVLPAHAGYLEMSKFRSPTQPRSGVEAALKGLEAILGEYAGDMNPWKASTPGTQVIDGVCCSTLSYGGATAAKDQVVRVG